MECLTNHKIAVAFDGNGKIAPFPHVSYIETLARENGEWRTAGKVFCQLNLEQGISGVRKTFKKLIEELDDCKVMIAFSISGVFYNILDAADFGIYEAAEYSEALLDAVLRDTNHKQASAVDKPDKEVETEPVETDVAGNYFFDLIRLQRYKPKISSKKALIPFLQNAAFYQLEVVCNHIPPWFDFNLPEMNLAFESAIIRPGEYRVTIYKKTCN